MAPLKRYSTRPYGEDLTRAIRVRLPPEVDSALRQVRRLFDVSVATQIRAGIERSLADMIPQAVAAVRSPETSNAMKLKLLEFLATTRRVHLALHDPESAALLRNARAEEANDKRRRPRSRPAEPPTDATDAARADLIEI